MRFASSLGLRALLALLPLAGALPATAQALTHLNVPANQLVSIEIEKSTWERSADEIGGVYLRKADGTLINWNTTAPTSGMTLVILDLQAFGFRTSGEVGATTDKTYRAVFTGWNTGGSYPFNIYLPVTFPANMSTAEGSGHYTFPGGMAFAHPVYPMIRLGSALSNTTRFYGHGYLVSTN